MRYALCFIIAAALVTSSAVRPVAQSASSSGTRIGVFDSRVVALAYYNTPEAQADLKQLTTDLAEARAANNKARIDELEFQGPALQNLMHYQVFSTASIPNVLDKIAGALPKIAADAGVQALVSKWEVAFKTRDVEYVDVTDRLVRAFNPSARVQQMIPQVAAQSPMPLLQAVKTMRPDR